MFHCSEEHINYLRNRKKEEKIICFFRLFILFIFLLIWELASYFSLINPFLFSSPSRIINTLYSLFKNGDLLYSIWITTYEVLISFILASSLGIVIATLMWNNKILSRIIDPYITVINSLPKVALGPLIIIWVGASTNSIIFMSLMISLFTTIMTVYQGFLSVPLNYCILMKSFGASKFQIYKKIILPASFDVITSTLKINISMSLIGVIMGELLVSKSGLGYLIMYGSQVFNLDLVISSIFVLGILSYFMYLVVDKILTKLKKKND